MKRLAAMGAKKVVLTGVSFNVIKKVIECMRENNKDMRAFVEHNAEKKYFVVEKKIEYNLPNSESSITILPDDKFSLIVFGDDVNTLIDLSSPFLGLERESPKNSRASPVSCRMEIVLIFTKSI